MRRWGVFLIVLVLLSLAGGTFFTVGRRSHQVCVDCGMYFQDRVMCGISMPSHRRELRTDWYDRRIGAPHPHRWTKSSCTAGLNLWQSPTYFSCGRGEPLTATGTWVATVLGRLEPLDLDVKYHKELTHQVLAHREAAAGAWGSFDPKWKDEEVRAWWEKTKDFLGDPNAWREGFAEFERRPR